MKKKLFVVILLLLVIVLFLVCGKDKFNSRKQIEAQYFDISPVDDYGMHEFAVTRDNVYFVMAHYLKNNPAPFSMNGYYIRSIDRNNGNSRVIFKSDDNILQTGFWINEFAATANGPVWCYQSDNCSEIKSIKADGSQLTVRNRGYYDDLVLGIGENQICWYSDESGLSLHIFDLNTDSEKIISDLLCDSPYTRPYILENNIAYVSKEDDEQFIAMINTESEAVTRLALSSDVEPTRVQGNSQYIIYTDSYNGSKLYYFDIAKGKTGEYSINSSDYIFSCFLYDRYVVINSRSRADGIPKVEIIELTKGKAVGEFTGYDYASYGMISYDGLYYSLVEMEGKSRLLIIDLR